MIDAGCTVIYRVCSIIVAQSAVTDAESSTDSTSESVTNTRIALTDAARGVSHSGSIVEGPGATNPIRE